LVLSLPFLFQILICRGEGNVFQQLQPPLPPTLKTKKDGALMASIFNTVSMETALPQPPPSPLGLMPLEMLSNVSKHKICNTNMHKRICEQPCGFVCIVTCTLWVNSQQWKRLFTTVAKQRNNGRNCCSLCGPFM
jgi:hypothetical protein